MKSVLRYLLRQYPFYSGCGTVANSSFIRWLDPRPGASLVWTETPGGELLVDPHDWVGRTIARLGDLDPKLTWVLRRLAKPGDQAIDIGSNFGLVSILLAR